MRDLLRPGPLAGSPTTPEARERRRRQMRRVGLVAGVLLVLALAYAGWRAFGTPASSPGTRPRADAMARPMPVSAAPAVRADMPVRLTALGTVIARSTVTVRTRVDGPVVRVNFDEGSIVKAGQLLAQIDPAPFEVALAQSRAQQAKDQAQLDAAKVDLERYRGLLKTDSIASQQVDTQEALVRQLEASVAADRAAVDNTRLQLSYTHIVAPVAGRVGLRQVDPGNIVHTSDANGLVVLTEVMPIYVIFPLPQDNLPAVLDRLRAGATLPVDAYDREGRRRLAAGRLITTDNVIDATTGTVKLKAQFDNSDAALFPNQFVNVRLQLDTVKDAVVVPTSSIQRGAPGTYVYVVREDSTVTVRPVKLGPADGEQTAIASGLDVGERVVSDGADKLREGATVQVIERGDAAAAAGGTPATPGKGDRKGDRKGDPGNRKRAAPSGS